jgi:hypothetical protein
LDRFPLHWKWLNHLAEIILTFRVCGQLSLTRLSTAEALWTRVLWRNRFVQGFCRVGWQGTRPQSSRLQVQAVLPIRWSPEMGKTPDFRRKDWVARFVKMSARLLSFLYGECSAVGHDQIFFLVPVLNDVLWTA